MAIGSIIAYDSKIDQMIDKTMDELMEEYDGMEDELTLSEGFRIFLERMGLPEGIWNIPIGQITVEQYRKAEAFFDMLDEYCQEFVPADNN